MPCHRESGHKLQAAAQAAIHLQARAGGPLPLERHGGGGRTRPRYVAAVAAFAVADGWRDWRSSGGTTIEVVSIEVVCEGLSLPHSPRLHDGRLWVLSSGAGEFGWVDIRARRFVPVAFCPRYARGVAFAGGAAVIGLSLARANRTFRELPLDAALAAEGAEPRCGIVIIDLATGDTIAWVRLEGAVRELYDVTVLPGLQTPSAIGFKTDEITRIITIEE